MTVPARILAFAGDLTAIRRDLHQHPELGFEEVRTSGIVTDALRSYGIEVTTGIGGTGVVGVLTGNRPGRRIGLRADMDALPIHETTNLPYASRTPGVMHACGHDGHTTILLGAARYLAETRDFAGTAIFIFQPAEEGLGGARRMIAEGLFDRFPCDEIYGLHNSPYQPPEVVRITPGRAQAGANFFDITVAGKGCHAAYPELGTDALVAATALVQQFQTVVSRSVAATEQVVVSVTRIEGGSAYNIIPDQVTLAGTVRYFDRQTAAHVTERMQAICEGTARAHAVGISMEMRNVFDVLENDPVAAAAMIAAATEVVGADKAQLTDSLTMGSEDFADMLQIVPGGYCTLGHAGTVPVHNPGYIFDDAILPVGAALLARMVETRGGA